MGQKLMGVYKSVKCFFINDKGKVLKGQFYDNAEGKQVLVNYSSHSTILQFPIDENSIDYKNKMNEIAEYITSSKMTKTGNSIRELLNV